MNRKIMKLMAACIITVIFLRNGMADICYAMNKTEIGRDDAGEASVTASLTANGARTSLNASSSETSDFQVQGYVYGVMIIRRIGMMHIKHLPAHLVTIGNLW